MDAHSLLRDLVELLTDSQRGYADAAERVTDPRARNILMKLGNSRTSGIMELSAELVRDGEEVSIGGTWKGTVHRAWMDVHDTVTRSHNSVMLAECERGESYLLRRYQDAIDSDQMPHHFRAILAAQQVLVKANRDEVHALKQLLEKEERR